jgi:ERCC4-type nuclease
MSDIRLILDTRERKLIDHYREYKFPENVSLSIEPLDIGDVHVVRGENRIVFERKTISDLCQSIKDGRWHEQKQRLLGTESISNICYVIEGSFDYVTEFPMHGLQKSALISSVLNTLFRDGIKVVTTRDLRDTICFFTCLLERVSKNSELYFRKSLTDDYVPNVVKSKRKENIDERACYMMQLCCIPSISLKTAERISDHLKVSSMCETIKLLTTSTCPRKTLCGVPGVGGVIADTILRYLKIES